MIPEILKIQIGRRRFKNNGSRRLSYLKVQNAQWAFDHADKSDAALVAKLQAELTESEVVYLKATVSTVSRIAGYFQGEIRKCRSREERANLKATFGHQQAIIAAAKAELASRGIK